MSSLPNQSNHLSTPVGPRAHRHKRSAAISGDFDSMGLGLFSPSPTSKSMSNINLGNPIKNSEPVIEKNFNFNNYEDFTNKSSSSDFSFPVKTPDIARTAPGSSPRHLNTLSPAKKTIFHSAGNSLNSPIKLNHKRASSYNASGNKNRFFLTEESNMNNENVPEAVIDLDEILNANLHIGGGYSSNNNSTTSLQQSKTEQVPEPYSDDDFLASPFVKQSSSPFVSSPLTSASNNYSTNIFNHGTSNPSNLLFNQPIQENTGDLIEEEEDDEGIFNDQREQSLEYIQSDNENPNDIFANMPPSHVLGSGLYSNMSANSSCSSLRSTNKPSNLIEKTFSNSSKDSANSSHNLSNSNTPTFPMLNSSTPTGKRSGAKANRYQIFYDQSNRISNALKVSSSESINIVRSNSSGNNLTTHPTSKESRSLGHSSSLPSLKSNPKRSIGIQRQNQSRFGDIRSVTPDYKRVPSPPIYIGEKLGSSSPSPVLPTSTLAELKISPSNLTPSLVLPNLNPRSAAISTNKGDRVNGSFILVEGKNVSASPISDHSDSAISSSETIQSTDHSSLTSHHEFVGKSKPTREVSKNFAISTPTTLNEVFSSAENSIADSPLAVTPSIIVSSGYDGTSSPSTSSTFKQDYFSDDQISQNVAPNDSTLVNYDSIYTVDGILNHGYPSQSPVSQKFQINSVDSCGSSIKSSKSSVKTSSNSSPKKPSPRRPMSSSEEKILKMTQIPTFKSSPLTRQRSSFTNPPSDPPSNVTPNTPAQVDTTQLVKTSPPQDKENVGKFKLNYNPFSETDSKRRASSNSQESSEFSKISLKSSALKSSLGIADVRSNQRRGSESISVLSLPVLSSGSNAGSASLLPKSRHSKSRSFSISLHDLTPKFSRSSTLIAEEGKDPGKKKSNKLIHWFRRK